MTMSPLTRADLSDHPAFAALGADTAGNPAPG